MGWSAFARRYLRNHYCFLFLGVLRCFSSPRSPRMAMYSPYVTGALPPVGFPIRKSPGQSLFSGSPKLIAAYHVLHRLSLPRHPPYALSSLTIKKPLINTAVHTSENAFASFPVFSTYRSFLCNCQRTSGVRGPGPGVRKSVKAFTDPGPRIPDPGYGGGERDRTDDPLRARQVLSQLSYTPI